MRTEKSDADVSEHVSKDDIVEPAAVNDGSVCERGRSEREQQR